MAKCVLAAMNEYNEKSNSIYGFENFMTFEGNMIAYNAAMAVAHRNENQYNPLFIYGAAGTGKTHLLRAIQDTASVNDKDKCIIYVTAEEFKNDVMTASESGDSYGMAMVRELYRHADVLLIDDVHCLSGEKVVLKELAFTIDSLLKNGGQIVFSANVPAKRLDMNEDIRFKMRRGLVIEIKAPDTSLKNSLIRVKAGEHGIILQDEVVDYITNNTGTNIGEIESAITSIVAYSELSKPVINLKTAQNILKDILTEK